MIPSKKYLKQTHLIYSLTVIFIYLNRSTKGKLSTNYLGKTFVNLHEVKRSFRRNCPEQVLFFKQIIDKTKQMTVFLPEMQIYFKLVTMLCNHVMRNQISDSSEEKKLNHFTSRLLNKSEILLNNLNWLFNTKLLIT